MHHFQPAVDPADPDKKIQDQRPHAVTDCRKKGIPKKQIAPVKNLSVLLADLRLDQKKTHDPDDHIQSVPVIPADIGIRQHSLAHVDQLQDQCQIQCKQCLYIDILKYSHIPILQHQVQAKCKLYFAFIVFVLFTGTFSAASFPFNSTWLFFSARSLE